MTSSAHFDRTVIPQLSSFPCPVLFDTLSVAKDFGKRSVAEKYPFDILNVNRLDDDGPDLGAYERQEKKQ